MARSKYKWRVAGLVLKIVGAVLIASLAAFLLWRIIDSNVDPAEMNTLIPNEELCSAYTESGGKLTAFNQNQSKFTRGENNYGYFAVTQSVFIKEADQLQVVLRYNNSTLEHTKEDYALQEIPARDRDIYDVTVTVMYDLTPDNTNDNDGKTPDAVEYKRFFPSDMISAQKTLYNYRKFVFDGIEINENVLGVYVDIYYVGDVNYEKDAYGSLLIYNKTDVNRTYRLSRADIKAIEAWREE